MDTPEDGEIFKDKFQNKQVFEQKLHGENETAYCQARDNVIEIGNIAIIEDKVKNMQEDTMSEVKSVADHLTNSSSALGEVENFHQVSSINLSDMYSTEKFGHDLLNFIEHGHSLENWHHTSFHDTTTDSFSSHMDMESLPIQQCINADIQSTSKSTITLTLLNSPSTDEPAHISFSFAQPNTQSSSVIDHDYCIYPKSGNSVAENYHGPAESSHGSVDNSAFMQPQQYEPGMDQEKLLRMKRRKEKNRECSRQFRLKQKSKEENLTKGKMEKARELENLKRNVEKLKSTLSKVAQQCSSKCPRTRMLLSEHANVNKENINPEYVEITK